jgi:uncharacterized protein (DUF2141 family)
MILGFKYIIMRLLVLLFFSLAIFLMSAQTLDIHIKDIRNQKGQLCIAVFANQDGFNAEKTLYDLKCTKNEVVNGELHLQLPFRSGKFGVSVLDDENGTGKMEYGFLGIPKKGFGFSNYYLKGLCKPVFDNFSFDIKKNEIKLLEIKMKYF